MINLSTKIVGTLLFLGLIIYACQTTKESLSQELPDENRFTTSVLNQPGSLNELMAFTFLNNEDMVIVEREGGVKTFNIESKEMRQIGFVPVNTIYTNKEGRSRTAEEGLMGVIAHPNYAENHWIFMLYADSDETKHVLARMLLVPSLKFIWMRLMAN